MLKGKTVLLGVTGSIAAYKIAYLASALKKLHAEVHVLMTKNATNFITPITFESLTGTKCLVDTFDRNFQFQVEHVSIAKKADADNTNVGTGTVVITGDGSNVIGSREVSFQIVVKSLAKPSSGTDLIAVEVIPDSFSYDGTEKKPTVLVTYQYGTEVEVRQLTEGSDFTVAYSNSDSGDFRYRKLYGIPHRGIHDYREEL